MTVVQNASNTGSSLTAMPITLGAATSSGSGIVVLADVRSSTAVVTVTDSQGNTYTDAGVSAANGSSPPNRVRVFYCTAADTTPGVTSVTVNADSASSMAARAFEVSALGSLADTDVLDDGGNLSASVAPVAAGAGFTCGAIVSGVTSRVFTRTSPSGATDGAGEPLTVSTNTYMKTAWLEVGAAGAVTYTWDRTSGSATTTGLLAAAFNEAASNPIPVVDAGAPQTVDTGSTVTLDGAASISSGSIASVLWTYVSGTAVTLTGEDTLNAQFVAPSPPGSTTLRLTATSDLGETNSATVTITYLTAGQYARPAIDVVTTGVTKSNPAAPNFFGLIDEVTPDDADYIRLDNGSEYRVTLTPFTPVVDDTGWLYRFRARVSADAVSHSMRIRVMQGATVIATDTITGVLGTGFATFTVTLSEAEAAAIPDRDLPLDLYIDTVSVTT